MLSFLKFKRKRKDQIELLIENIDLNKNWEFFFWSQKNLVVSWGWIFDSAKTKGPPATLKILSLLSV